MRVGILIYGSLEIVSGGYLYDRQLVNYLHTQGAQVEVISLPWRNYLRHLGDNLSVSLSRQLRSLQIDALLQDELNHPSLFWLNRRLRPDLPYPIITIVHHLRSSEKRPAWQNRLYGWIEANYLVQVDGFIYNSQTTQRAVEKVVGSGMPAVVAYPAGDRLNPSIQSEEIIRRAHDSSPLRLLFLGNIIPRKGLHTLLEAAKGLPRESWALSVVGSPEMDTTYTQMIRRQVQEEHLDRQVHFLGALDQKELSAQLESSHILVVPSTYEGFGIAYLEGMGFGLPAIASQAGGAVEIIDHGVNGFLIPPEDSLALSGYLSLLNQDRDLLAKMGLAARGRYERHPTWEQTGAQIYRFLERMVRN